MRLPSFAFSVAALALFAWWMRTRGVAGVVAVAVMAVSPFQIMYGGEARMYALLELLGVLAAMLAEAWIREPRRWHAAAAGGLVLLGVFDHVSGFLLAGGLVALAGLRHDRAAWRWRAWIVGAVALWAAVWGASFLTQASTTHASWIEPTTIHSVPDAVTAQVTNQQGVALLVFAAVVVGIVLIATTDRVLGRVVLCCAVLPVVAAAVIGVFVPVLPRSHDHRRGLGAVRGPRDDRGPGVASIRLMGVAVAVLVGALVVPATLVFLEPALGVRRVGRPSRGGRSAGRRRGHRPGLVRAPRGLARRGAGVRRGAAGAGGHSSRTRTPSSSARTRRRAACGSSPSPVTTGRIRASTRCAPDWTDDVTVVSCLVVPGADRDHRGGARVERIPGRERGDRTPGRRCITPVPARTHRRRLSTVAIALVALTPFAAGACSIVARGFSAGALFGDRALIALSAR